MTERQKLFLLSIRVSNCTPGWTLRTIDIKQVILLPEERKAFLKIGINITGPIVTFRGLQRLYDQIHSYSQKPVKNGSICEIEPGHKFISVKCFCQVENNTYVLGYLFRNKQGVLFDTSTNEELTDLHLADSKTHTLMFLVS